MKDYPLFFLSFSDLRIHSFLADILFKKQPKRRPVREKQTVQLPSTAQSLTSLSLPRSLTPRCLSIQNLSKRTNIMWCWWEKKKTLLCSDWVSVSFFFSMYWHAGYVCVHAFSISLSLHTFRHAYKQYVGIQLNLKGCGLQADSMMSASLFMCMQLKLWLCSVAWPTQRHSFLYDSQLCGLGPLVSRPAARNVWCATVLESPSYPHIHTLTRSLLWNQPTQTEGRASPLRKNGSNSTVDRKTQRSGTEQVEELMSAPSDPSSPPQSPHPPSVLWLTAEEKMRSWETKKMENIRLRWALFCGWYLDGVFRCLFIFQPLCVSV